MCWGVGRVAMDTGQGRGACFLQFPAEALWACAGSETVPRLG